jgi:hypothetical protein
MKVRRSFFDWFSNEYHFRVRPKRVAVWDGTKYVWDEKHKAQYRHYWRFMWWHIDNEQRKLLLTTMDCIVRSAIASWWDWKDGSIPFFWRWSAEYHYKIWDVILLWYTWTALRNFLSQKKEKDQEVRRSMGAKLVKVFARRYFIYGMTLSLTSFFAVPKGGTHIWMVYNETSSGMNAHL